MNYIAVELKVLEASGPGLARALGSDLASVVGSLTLLWHRCWSLKSDRVTRLELRGYFAHADAPDYLCAFGFIVSEGDEYRVKGADRYLRISSQRSAAGKARSSSAGRSAGRFTSTPPATPPAADQRTTSGGPALTPSTEHRAPNTESKSTAPASRAPRDSDALCQDFLEATGSPYRWQGVKDGAALASMLKANTIDEIRARWQRGLRSTGWQQVRTVAQLNFKWNDLAAAPASTGRGPVDPDDWSDVTPGEVIL